MFLQHSHRLLNSSFQLRISSCDYILRIILHVYIRRDTFVLNGPPSITGKESTAGSNHRASVNEGRCISGMDQTAPCSFSNQQTNLSSLEHVRHQTVSYTHLRAHE